MNEKEAEIDLLRNNLKPVLSSTLRMTIGVMVVSFHLSTRCTASGIGGPLSECEAKLIYGGTLGKRLAASGADDTRRPTTQSAVAMDASDRLPSMEMDNELNWLLDASSRSDIDPSKSSSARSVWNLWIIFFLF